MLLPAPEILGIVDDACAPLELATFVPGAAGPPHLPVGVLVSHREAAIGFDVRVTDAVTGELFAERVGGYFALAGWTEQDPVGWTWKDLVVDYGTDFGRGVVCDLEGRTARVEVTVGSIGDELVSTASVDLPADFDDRWGLCP